MKGKKFVPYVEYVVEDTPILGRKVVRHYFYEIKSKNLNRQTK